MTEPDPRNAQLAALRHKLGAMVEDARAARDSAIRLRNGAADPAEFRDLDDTAVRCAAFGNAVRVALLRLNRHLPNHNGETTHEPISPR